jgi:serine/threonine-protein kinase
MNRSSGAALPRALVVAVDVMVALRIARVWERLPARMASHFDGVGRPNGWATRESFVGLFALLIGGVALMFLILPALLRLLPASMIDLPNRGYWLAPARRDETIGELGRCFAWYAFATVLFAACVLELVVRANLTRAPLAGLPMWLLLGSYGVFVVLWLIGLFAMFRLRR